MRRTISEVEQSGDAENRYGTLDAGPAGPQALRLPALSLSGAGCAALYASRDITQSSVEAVGNHRMRAGPWQRTEQLANNYWCEHGHSSLGPASCIRSIHPVPPLLGSRGDRYWGSAKLGRQGGCDVDVGVGVDVGVVSM